MFRPRRTLGVAVLLATTAAPVRATTVVLAPTADTYLRQGGSNANEGATRSCASVRPQPRPAALRSVGDRAAAGGMVVLSAHLELFAESASNWGPGRAVGATA